jgi:hypothetical protein
LQTGRIDHRKHEDRFQLGALKRGIGSPIAFAEVLNQEVGYCTQQVPAIDSMPSECGSEADGVDLVMTARARGNAKKIVPRRLSPFSGDQMVWANARLIAEEARFPSKKPQIVLCDPSSPLGETHRVFG